MAKRIAKESTAVSADEVASFKFNKRQLLKSQKYAERTDLLNALLKDEEVYTFAQVDDLIKRFDEGGTE
ncbi:hypothetical protein [Psychrobacillus sp. NPDC093200]|uniref:hypothetical protein n=1 Tax=Psychrobacillus sp. NPDC093200 TaxID=3390656 RepID=UPI003D03C229